MERQLEFYEIHYGGTKIPPKQRRRLLRRAYAWLNLQTLNCRSLRLEHEEAFLQAVCAAADALFELERGVVLREQNGELAVNYAERLSATERQLVMQAAYPYLCGTGLLYSGVSGC